MYFCTLTLTVQGSLFLLPAVVTEATIILPLYQIRRILPVYLQLKITTAHRLQCSREGEIERELYYAANRILCLAIAYANCQ